MGENPEQLRRDIEATRRELTADVDALTEKVSPARVVDRRVQGAKSAVSNLRDRVMGGAPERMSDLTASAGTSVATMASGVGDAAGSASSAITSAASSAGSTVAGAPQLAKRRTEGNPLAAGVIAFGVGWLASSLLPASQREQDAASKVTDLAKEHADPVKAHLAGVVNEVKDNLRDPAGQAVESLKATAQEAAATMKDEAKSAGGDVADQSKAAAASVQEEAGSGGTLGAPVDQTTQRVNLDESQASRESSTY